MKNLARFIVHTLIGIALVMCLMSFFVLIVGNLSSGFKNIEIVHWTTYIFYSGLAVGLLTAIFIFIDENYFK